MKNMSISEFLRKNPNLIKVRTHREKTIKKIYEDSIKHDILSEIAREYADFIDNSPMWKIDRQTISDNFNFGMNISKDYNLSIEDISKIFNELIPKYFNGGLIGFFISGIYHLLIKDNDILELNLRSYQASISGLGYRHPKGVLKIKGDKAYHIGTQMSGGEIHIFGNVGNHIGKEIKGGKIIIYGNARNFIGEKMEGGLILIKGDAMDAIGLKMTGGEIIIEGKAGYWIGEKAKGGIINVLSM